MYRDGRTEYLLNGSVCRRMDIMDILHDAGLGAGAHSIISQGSLDEVLQSRPIERRALIEEAAGVLKHKQRLEKSERKLDKLLESTSRVRDIANEVGRQLKPLERKAKKAKTFNELNAQLTEIKIDLAVDNLKKLNEQWDEILKREQVLNSDIERLKKENEAAEENVERAQLEIRSKTQIAGEISQKYRSISAAAEKMSSTQMFLHERLRAFKARASELAIEAQNNDKEIERLNDAYFKARKDSDESAVKRDEASNLIEVKKSELAEVKKSIDAFSKKLREVRNETAQTEVKINRVQKNLSDMREAHAKNSTRLEMLNDRIAELELGKAKQEADARSANEIAQSQAKALSELTEQAANARELVAACTSAWSAASSASEQADASLASIDARIKALNDAEKEAAKYGSAARSEIAKRGETLGLDITPLSHFVRAEKQYEAICERVLAECLDAFVGSSDCKYENISDLLKELSTEGSATFVSCLKNTQDRSTVPLQDIKTILVQLDLKGEILAEHVQGIGGAAFFIQNKLQHVIICDSLKDCLDNYTRSTLDLDFYSKDGQCVLHDGRIILGAKAINEEGGTLARLRALEELKAALQQAQKTAQSAKEKAQEAQKTLREAQSASLETSETLASAKGSEEVARKNAKIATEKLETAAKELSDAIAQKESIEKLIDESAPSVDDQEQELSLLKNKLSDLEEERHSVQSELAPLRSKEESISTSLNSAKLDFAKLSERATYEARVAARFMQDLNSIKNKSEIMLSSSKAKEAASQRLTEILSIFDILVNRSAKSVEVLESQAVNAQNAGETMQSQLNDLRAIAKEARERFEQAGDAQTDLKISKARLEVQVQNAITEITQGLGVSLENALLRNVTEDTDKLQEVSLDLERRIANLGTINPDAAEEYDALLARYEFFDTQLRDLDGASRVLRQINKIIKERIKNDFEKTFETVNINFQNCFTALFPGGSAHLTLEELDFAEGGEAGIDGENQKVAEAGIEVHAQPAGKKISKMSLMSGGEKSLTALALLFAIYTTNNAPFYVLDEVEAALDDTNLRRLVDFVDSMRARTQIIMITHQRRTMEASDVLFGISMGADAVTKVISQKLEHALKLAE
jgi:chromosome segregation protein